MYVRTPMHKVGPPLQQFSLAHPQQCSIHPLSCLSHVDAFLLPVCSLYQNLHRVKQKMKSLTLNSFLWLTLTSSFLSSHLTHSFLHLFLPSPPSRPLTSFASPPSLSAPPLLPFSPLLPPSLSHASSPLPPSLTSFNSFSSSLCVPSKAS